MCGIPTPPARLRQTLVDAAAQPPVSHDGRPQSRPDATPMRRRKLWELEEKLHCPVIGSCLSLTEVRSLARERGDPGGRVDAYALHVETVSLTCHRNPLAEAVHKRLDRKFAESIRAFERARSDPEVLALWRQHFDRGEVPGALRAAVTHKHASADTRHAVYADIHMLSHQVGAGRAADLARLAWLEREHAALVVQRQADVDRQRRELAEREAQIRRLGNLLQQARRDGVPESVRSRLRSLETGVAMTGMGRRLMHLTDEVGRLTERNAELTARVAELDAVEAGLREALATATGERDALESVLATGTAAADDACGGDCAHCTVSLRGRCVLCVGGRTPLLPQYRQLAERLGVRLIHHDGGREESLSRLPGLLASSDAVICPTDCVGHLAYYRLKQHCEQANKPCVLLRSSGMASFAAALTRLAEGAVDIT